MIARLMGTMFLCCAVATAAESEDLAKDFRSKTVSTRIKAVETVAAMKDVDDANLRHVFAACLDPSPKVVAAAMKVVESKKPDIHKHVVTLNVDRNLYNRRVAVEFLGKDSATCELLAVIVARGARAKAGGPENAMAETAAQSLAGSKAVLPADVFQVVISGGMPNIEVDTIRSACAEAVVHSASKDEDRATDAKPLVIAVLKMAASTPKPTAWDRDYAIRVIRAVPAFRAGSGDYKDAIGELKLHPDGLIRNAANEAWSRIKP